ncbi:hypothetical protein [Rodentibacter genomosp. 2]|uniref:Uncharacterized protein n=1 Tax=Rodentibacter genomosp. 2 TaxID=1908266 RepID=A0A1V3JAD0_9PAST|nr:hypothetical protein [Rodentibacter genomosp. 2]OOF52780.1 hypothetical protein BKK55_11895 [Rodentibacter genomosp. 2]
MSSLSTSMASAISAMLPFSFDTSKENDEKVIKAKMLESQLRLQSVNQMLVLLLNVVESDPSFWLQVNNIAMLKAHFSENKAYIDEIKHHFTGESKTVALLDNMKETILKLECLMPQESDFNFDLARMEERINERFFECPSDLKDVDEFRNWLQVVANEH